MLPYVRADAVGTKSCRSEHSSETTAFGRLRYALNDGDAGALPSDGTGAESSRSARGHREHRTLKPIK